MATHEERVATWLREHPGVHKRADIAKGSKVPTHQLASILALAAKHGAAHHVGTPRSGLWESGPGVELLPATQNGNGHGEKAAVLPDTLNFRVAGVLSDGRLILEFKKTADVFVAKRLDV